MESQLSSIFQLKLITKKKKCLGPWEPNAELYVQYGVSFGRRIQFF